MLHFVVARNFQLIYSLRDSSRNQIMSDPQQEITQILQSIDSGDPDARAELLCAAYDDLRRLAAGKMAAERQNHTLTATALVNEISARLLSDQAVPTENRGQFFAYAAKSMRNMLIDHARAKGRLMRGGDRERVPLEHADIDKKQCEKLLLLNDALDRFAELDARKAQVVEMKYFGRMTNEEIASALSISLATVKRDWEVAKAWLYDALKED